MAEDFYVPISDDRQDLYTAIIPQIRSLISHEPNFFANAANTVAALQQTFGFLWTGCYFIEKNELVLGPFQGPVACTRIAHGKGVCGQAWLKNHTIIVPDVHQFPGHIACSALSKSEIVVPLRKKNGELFGVLDIDSASLNDFNEIDQLHLEEISRILSERFGE